MSAATNIPGFSARDKRSLSRALKRIAADARTNHNQQQLYGICINLGGKNEKLAKRLFEKWPKFSGNVSYPVPDPDARGSVLAERRYWASYSNGTGTCDRWSGDYGALRWELLNWMIEQLAPFDKRGVRKAKP